MSNEKSSNKLITKDTIHRLLKDIKDIIRNPLHDHNIFYKHDEEDMLKGYALIIGPEDTPYFGGNYFFEFAFPYDYPYSPPKLTFCTNNGKCRFNPNLYINGKVCISILNTWEGDKWSSCQTISTILLTLATLFTKEPLLNEPGITRTNDDFINYNKVVEFNNYEFAFLHMSQEKNIHENFKYFYPVIKEKFLLNYQKVMDNVVDILDKREIKGNEKFYIKLYNLLLIVNYSELKENLLAVNSI
jgi:ubiquitin-protein ligase